jgi:hypothetical protein
MARQTKIKSLYRTMESEQVIINSQNNSPYFFLDVSSAFTLAYALCYIFSPFVGLQMLGVQPTLMSIVLIGVGIGLILCIYTKNRYLILLFAGSEAFFCVAHFLKLIPWLPLFTDTQYVAMSYLDLIQATLLFMQFRVNNKSQ